MNKLVMLFLVVICFSCVKKKYTTESLLLENLIESSNFYEEEIKDISASIESKYNDYSGIHANFDTLKSITKKLDIFLDDLKTKNYKEKILLQEKFISSINNFNSEYKLNSFMVEKLEILDDETLYYYLKFKLYKNQFENYKKHYSKLHIYCGYKMLTTKQYELIKIIENSDIK
ncbi:MAG: hypothetical protein O9282_03545 [Flavobacterium sp.]|jgi:hypothetical protein|uniref:hypothetical protein n=1 Tax=Flavobacterium sp. TaxID=239 RepID=UPI0022CB09BC|nr:hypothetical protein [Flavobacterium sp.]MCZ8330368.1 hypothetical protein [Flavobacterium sp.]